MLGAAFFGCGKKNDKAAAEQSETAAPTTESTTAPDPKPVLSGDAALNDGETYTGRAPLPLVDFNVSDPENTRGLSTEKHGYGYGIAKDGKPNDISVNNQKYFETNGYKAVCLDTKSTDKVLYLTFDCGYENGYTAKILDTLKEKQVTAAFFLHTSAGKGKSRNHSANDKRRPYCRKSLRNPPLIPDINKTPNGKRNQGHGRLFKNLFRIQRAVFPFPDGRILRQRTRRGRFARIHKRILVCGVFRLGFEKAKRRRICI